MARFGDPFKEDGRFYEPSQRAGSRRAEETSGENSIASDFFLADVGQ